jgi:hypothetical protein
MHHDANDTALRRTAAMPLAFSAGPPTRTVESFRRRA